MGGIQVSASISGSSQACLALSLQASVVPVSWSRWFSIARQIVKFDEQECTQRSRRGFLRSDQKSCESSLKEWVATLSKRIGRYEVQLIQVTEEEWRSRTGPLEAQVVANVDREWSERSCRYDHLIASLL